MKQLGICQDVVPKISTPSTMRFMIVGELKLKKNKIIFISMRFISLSSNIFLLHLLVFFYIKADNYECQKQFWKGF